VNTVRQRLNDRIGVMMVSLACAGRAISLLWRSYVADEAGTYPAQVQVLAHVLSVSPASARL